VAEIAEHLFRQEAGRLVATLARIFGLERLHLAEDVVQEALIRALQTWPFHGVPDKPSAWITQTAKNLALDVIRREAVFRAKEPEIAAGLERMAADATSSARNAGEHDIKDDRLRMVFVCCHPAIPEESQIALALKTLCGFGSAEIAHAFFTSEATIAKRLTRAKQRIREARLELEIPAGDELAARLDVVLHTLYLLFNEGYKASSGDSLVRAELCGEAIRLATLLVEHPAGDQPRTHALLALMLLNAARLPARADAGGTLLRLDEQDRTTWDRALIGRGMLHLARSAAGDELTDLHLQAGIAACHSAAPAYEATDWPHILSLYDRLVEMDGSPVVALNRAVAVAHVHGPRAGIDAVNAIRNRSELESYHLVFAVLGELEARLGEFETAAQHFERALALTRVRSEAAFLSRLLRECHERTPPAGATVSIPTSAVRRQGEGDEPMNKGHSEGDPGQLLQPLPAGGPAEHEIVMTRVFDAPRTLVFEAWTEPERVMRWWGPNGFTTPVCRVDLRPGGMVHTCMRSPEGQDFWSRGTYREIVAPERIVATDSFADADGNVVEPTYYGMDASWPREALITVTFAEQEGKTALTLRHAVGSAPARERQMCRQGWSESFDRLADYLAAR
jgi:RNA polymerase sigma factor (sigma-70 family)